MDFGGLPNPATVVKVKPPSEELLPPSSSSVLATTINVDKNARPIPDELALLMGQTYISREDLINFRLVSKGWRDAATSVLLKQNVCLINLRKQRLRVTSREDPNYKTYAMYNCRYKKTHKTLDDLTSLMSTSPQFPVSHFGIVGHQSRNNKFNRYNDHSELHRFLLLHGTHVKTLRLKKSVSMKELDLYNTYLVKLERLEFDGPFLCKTKGDESSSINNHNLNSTCHFRSITTLCINYLSPSKKINKTKLLRLVLNSPTSQLKYVQNVELDSLQVLLEVKKTHLITEFSFSYMPEVQTYKADKVLQILQELAKVCSAPNWDSRLKNLLLDTLEVEHCPAIVDAINAILDSCKDSLDHLEITYEPVVFQTPIIIPPMKNLKSIVLAVGDWGSGKPVQDGHVFRFEKVSNSVSETTNIPLSLQAIFPKLYSVRLILNKTTKYNRSSTFLDFFKMADLKNEGAIRGDIDFIPTVKKLETNFICMNLSDAKALTAMFPNVKTFKNRLDPMYMFQNAFWVMCPLAESIEIWDISWTKNSQVEMVDQFLTGFPFEICEKMRNMENDDPSGFLNKFGLLPFLKMLSAISDMPHLRRLKFKFEELASQFTSQVSAAYAFQKMPDLKIAVSYDPATMEAVDGPEQHRVAVGDGYLASIAPYAKIIHEEQ